MNDWEIFTAVLIGSAVVFLTHKVEDRFSDTPGKSCNKDHPNAWQCEFPGQIVSHKPWSAGVGVLVCAIYLLIAGLIIAGVSRMAANAVSAPKRAMSLSLAGVLLFSVFWSAWGAWETHHMRKTIHRIVHKKKAPKRGVYFSRMFTQYIFFIYVPVTVWFLLRRFY